MRLDDDLTDRHQLVHTTHARSDFTRENEVDIRTPPSADGSPDAKSNIVSGGRRAYAMARPGRNRAVSPAHKAMKVAVMYSRYSTDATYYLL